MTDSEGWKTLVEGYPWYRGAGRFPLPAYSEFMPPPRFGLRPYGETDPFFFSAGDPFGWPISEIEQQYEIIPGLDKIAHQIVEQLVNLGTGEPAYKIAGHKGRNLEGNPYWPPALQAQAGRLPHEHYVVLLPLALSRTQDDMGRIRWTFFGSSEQGPERAFWSSFYSAPGKELPAAEFETFMRRLLAGAFGEKIDSSTPLARLGLRILPSTQDHALPYWSASLPSWVRAYTLADDAPLDQVRYLLTFRPFSQLAPAVQDAYFAGRLALLPFPGSLVFWGIPTYLDLHGRFPFALQAPLQRLVERHGGPDDLRVPQSGWLHYPRESEEQAEIQAELLLNTATRTSRWDRVRRDEDEVAASGRVDHVARVLFSTELDDIGLYDKPEARNAQVWTEANEFLLDGPRAGGAEIQSADDLLHQGGLFRYRFQFPPMQVGRYAVYWQRPLAAYLGDSNDRVEVLVDGPSGYLTAYDANAPDLANPIELWPRLLRRQPYLAALASDEPDEHYKHQNALNALSLLDNQPLYGRPLPRTFARQMLRLAKKVSIEDWLGRLGERIPDAAQAQALRTELEHGLDAEEHPALPPAITFPDTATRSFEVAFWDDIVTLSQGDYKTKDNADIVDDEVTEREVKHHKRDLEQLGDYLLARHAESIAQAGLEGQALAGELPFQWQTDLDYPDFRGWKANQDGKTHERDLLVVIPGKNRAEAVVMADHYDTAYEEDEYDKSKDGSGARLAAPGADDNASATVTLLQAAPIFCKLAREGRLERDVWLLHLTGEEFPADCMGARHFCQALVEGTLTLHAGERQVDLTGTRVAGVFVMDMIAHNRDGEPDIFQISPGRGPGSLQLAAHAHLSNVIWNKQAAEWNEGPERRGLKPGVRSKDASQIPEMALFPVLEGQVRTTDDPQSSLYNTDGQIFSDVGVPVVLFMENYDINRSGYHDKHDTMENIDLDYGAALSRICIETVARVACAPPSERL